MLITVSGTVSHIARGDTRRPLLLLPCPLSSSIDGVILLQSRGIEIILSPLQDVSAFERCQCTPCCTFFPLIILLGKWKPLFWELQVHSWLGRVNLCLFFFLAPRRISVPQPGIEPASPALEVWRLNHGPPGKSLCCISKRAFWKKPTALCAPIS